MGLLDSVLGSLGSGNALLDGVISMVNNPEHGGLEGLVAAFRDKGLAGVVDSWVSTGGNLPVSADEITHVLGSDRLGSLAQGLGLSQGDLSSRLTELLPQVVDRLTPQGQVPDAGALGDLLGSLKDHLG